MEKLLIMNPGSTSTKIAVYNDETPVFVESIAHSTEELAQFDEIKDQYEFRRDMILDALDKHGVKLEELTAIVSRCGLLPPIEAGELTRIWYGSCRTIRRTTIRQTSAHRSLMLFLLS